ncbi:hypothetical protein [Streptomyces sp. TLI_171]|uniref:hypothetical protein n=1 Tax=Streptomyces sp. TLI_171 TaxID=1938859 RepID=UPI000C1A3AF7|nr:hypothetical protein [Streptomyces sp. TLI_171]RKE17663.1 hypothetical protein BX266_0925 [Streptomyces sp. TLI_171]
MSSGLRLVGLVGSARIQAALALPVALVSCVPVFLWGPSGGQAAIVAALLFGVTFLAGLRGLRASLTRRLAEVTAPPPGLEVVPDAEEFDLHSRNLTLPLVLALAAGAGIGVVTGVPAGMALAGPAVAMLWLSRWLAAEERHLGGRVVCVLAPLLARGDEPALDTYTRADLWIVRP